MLVPGGKADGATDPSFSPTFVTPPIPFSGILPRKAQARLTYASVKGGRNACCFAAG